MASFYLNLSNEEDMLQTTHFLNQKLSSYPSSELPNDKAYESQHSVSLSYPNLLSNNDRGEIEDECIGSRDEMIFITPTRMHQIDGEMNHHGSELIQNYHGLSLSLGSQVQSSLDLNHYTNSSLYSMVSSEMQSEIQFSQNNGLKNVQYLSFDLAGKTSQDTVKYEDLTNFHQNMNSSQTTNFMPSLTFCNSKYIKAAQDLLEDVVNVHKLSKQSEKKYRDFNDHDGSAGIDMKLSSDVHESNDNSNFRDLLPSERHDLQNKKTKLFSMLDEVDKRYKQYFHQMQAVASSFDAVAGQGSAQPYTSLALRTISRQFRSLRDAIKKQIQSTQKSLGEEDSNLHGQNVLSRLRYVDQQLRQQKLFQQFGITRQPWRPQRGLPETAVSVLRAWLFEHFLHPYPKDSEKIVLARQTGLSRSQVANWFINARVRLWKPMIEDMYKEEFGDTETEPKSSPEQHQATTITTTPRDFSVFDEREDKFQTGMINLMSEDNGHMQSYELRADDIHISSEDVNLQREDLGYESGAFQDNEVNFGLTHLPNKQILNMAAWQ